MSALNILFTLTESEKEKISMQAGLMYEIYRTNSDFFDKLAMDNNCPLSVVLALATLIVVEERKDKGH